MRKAVRALVLTGVIVCSFYFHLFEFRANGAARTPLHESVKRNAQDARPGTNIAEQDPLLGQSIDQAEGSVARGRESWVTSTWASASGAPHRSKISKTPVTHLTDVEHAPAPSAPSIPDEKIVVIGKLTSHNTTWVGEELPE